MNNLVWHISTLFVLYFSLLMGVLTNFFWSQTIRLFLFCLCDPRTLNLLVCSPWSVILFVCGPRASWPLVYLISETICKCISTNLINWKSFVCNFWIWQLPVGFSVVEVSTLVVVVISGVVGVISVVVETK